MTNAPPPQSAEPATTIVSPNDTGERGITLSTTVFEWLPALSLTAALVSVLFFSWIGCFPAGHRVFAQTPLQALFASFDRYPIAGDLQHVEKELESAIRSNWLMLPFLLALIGATLLAWLERFFPNPTLTTVPSPLGWMVNYQPRRFLVLILLTLLSLLLIELQSRRGFGLENAVNDVVAREFAEKMQKADNTTAKLGLEIDMGRKIGSFCLDDTLAESLGRLALMIALVSLLIRRWLDLRGPKPSPRLILKF